MYTQPGSIIAGLPTGTVSFLFTDLEGSTQLAQQQQEGMNALLDQHHTVLRQAIEAWHGHVFRVMGDAFCAVFFTASDCICAALQAQKGMQGTSGQPVEMRVRMGIHTGTAQPEIVGPSMVDYSGYLTLTRAQRVMSIAHGGQILVSNATAELVRGELPEGVELRDMGEHRLKGLVNLEQVFQLTAPDLPSEFPALSSLNAIPNNLPTQFSSFIGREREISEAARLLKTTRLITLTGVGGVGKTRLSLQIAAETLDSFENGVWMVELASLADSALILNSVATVLGLREAPGRPLSIALVDYLRAKNVLLILDNCEHLIEACAKLAERLLSGCPHLHILASSREALGIAGETILQVPSLALPDQQQPSTLSDLARSEAVQLFLDRARAIQPGFALNDRNSQAILHICQRLDGIPLAIELAAARVKMFSAEQVLARLDDRFRLLTGGSRTALPRQQTLRAMIDWSYDLLPTAEQVIFRRLSVFAGGWTYEAAESVAGQDGKEDLELLDLLAHLIDKSLVMVDERSKGDAIRYRFLETIRQYGGEKLVESGEAAQVRNKHLSFFLQFADEIEPKLLGPEQVNALDLVETEHDNLRAALAWSMDNHPQAALRLAGVVRHFWMMRGYAAEGQKWLTDALTKVDSLPHDERQAAPAERAAKANALLGLGFVMLSQGNNSLARDAFEKSAALSRQIGEKGMLARALSAAGLTDTFIGRPVVRAAFIDEVIPLAREVGDDRSWLIALSVLAYEALTRGDREAERAYIQEALALSYHIADPWSTGMAIMGTGIAAAHQGDFSEAQSRFEESLRLFREIGDRYRINMALSELAHITRRQGQYQQALSLYRETILVWQDLGHRSAVAHQLECIAHIASTIGNQPLSVRLLGAAETLREKIQAPMTLVEREEYTAFVSNVRQLLGEAQFAKAWAEGRAMAMEEAISYALDLAVKESNLSRQTE